MPLRSHSVVACFAPRPLSFAPSSGVGAAAVRTYHVIYLPKTAGLDVLVARARGESAERRATRVRRAHHLGVEGAELSTRRAVPLLL